MRNSSILIFLTGIVSLGTLFLVFHPFQIRKIEPVAPEANQVFSTGETVVYSFQDGNRICYLAQSVWAGSNATSPSIWCTP